VVVEGDVGSGKNIFLMDIAVYHTLPTVPILSNFEIKLPNYQPLEPATLMTWAGETGTIFLDEAYTWLESRTSGKDTNLYWSYILNQSRKLNLWIYVSCQDSREIDVRFRRNAAYWVYCRRVKEIDKDGFQYAIMKLGHNECMINRFLPFEKAEKDFFNLYNSWQVVQPSTMKDLSFSFVESNPKQLESMTQQAVVDLKDLGRITREAIEVGIVKKGYPKKLAKYVWVRMKEMKAKE
jgi:hypothetical protein